MQDVMKQTAVAVLVLTMAWPAAAQQPAPQEPGAKWKALAQSLPVGTEIEIRVFDGPKLRGTLVSASDEALVVQPRKQRDQREVKFSEIDDMKNTTPTRWSQIRTIAIWSGVAVGAALLAALFIAMSGMTT